MESQELSLMPSTDADLLNFSAHARVLLGLTAIAWLVHLINFNGWLSQLFGLRPRNFWGLIGIPLMPFLHSGAKHLTNNTQVFLLLGWFILTQGIHLFYVVTIATALISGIGTWLFSSARLVVGASGVTYGYRGFLLMYGITSGSLIALLLTAIVAVRDYWKITGTHRIPSQILPGENRRMAWDAHLYGFMGGAFIALLLGDMRLSHL